jgi:Putative zinc-finger
MLKCDDVINLLPEYASGELPSEEERHVRAHLEKCGKCAVELAQADAVEEVLSRLGGKEPSESFISNVMAALPERPEPMRQDVADLLKAQKRMSLATTLMLAAAVLYSVSPFLSNRIVHLLDRIGFVRIPNLPSEGTPMSTNFLEIMLTDIAKSLQFLQSHVLLLLLVLCAIGFISYWEHKKAWARLELIEMEGIFSDYRK